MVIPKGISLVDSIKKHLEGLSARGIRRCKYSTSLIVTYASDSIPTYMIKPKVSGMLMLVVSDSSSFLYHSVRDGSEMVWKETDSASDEYHKGVVRSIVGRHSLDLVGFSDKLSMFTQTVFGENTESSVAFCEWFFKGDIRQIKNGGGLIENVNKDIQ